MDSDGFQLVSRKKAARRKHLKSPVVTLNSPQENVNECGKKILKAKDALQSSEGYAALCDNLNTIENHFKHTVKVSMTHYIKASKLDALVCYGIGLPSCSRIARYQTALLLILRDQFDVTVEVYDPLFTRVDTQVLEDFGLKVLTKNEEGKRTLKGFTIFFMPHCGRELYNNLLWANWSPYALPMCVIIGNSFTSIMQNVPTRVLKQYYHFIYEAANLCKEHPIGSLIDYDDVFNDLSIHIVPVESAGSKSKEFWLKKREPTYNDCDVEIVRKKM